jgi:hypothetical protein
MGDGGPGPLVAQVQRSPSTHKSKSVRDLATLLPVSSLEPTESRRNVEGITLRRLSLIPRARTLRYVFIAVVAFSLGGALTVQAVAPSGILGTIRIADGAIDTRLATIDSSGNLQVKVNNLTATQAVTGTVSVSNFPATQPVSGTVSVSSGRVILLGTNITAPTGNGNGPAAVDTSDCRSLTAMARHQGVASDITIRLVQENPDESGFGVVNGTLVGIMTYFTVGGTPIVSPRASLSVQSNEDDPIIVEKLWLYCGH